MHPKKPGHRFEDQVVVHLHHAGADIERSEDLDLYKCVDFSLRRFPETVLPKPIDVQLTFRGGNADKLERFRDMRTGRDTLKLYAVPHPGMKAEEAAHQIHLFAFVAARDGTFDHATMLGIKLNTNSLYQIFDIDDRIEHLRQCEDPILSAGRRLLGRLVLTGKNGSCVNVLGVENGRTYLLRKSDVIIPKLKFMLENLEDFNDVLAGCKITFIPHRDHALSVLLA